MKRIIICMLLVSVFMLNASALYIPDSEVCENRDGRQLIVKTFSLSLTDDPDLLIEEPFEREGYRYSYISIVKDEQTYERRKIHTETVTIETDSKDLAEILKILSAAQSYDDGEYSGVLALDHTTLQTEASGYSARYYTVTDTKIYDGFDRNDPSFIPGTTVKDGLTLTLQNIEWSVQGMALSGDSVVPTRYTAVARYSAGASYWAADGYITTASYSGEIVSRGIDAVVYTVTYVGEPIPEPESAQVNRPLIRYMVYTGIALLLTAGAVAVYLFARRNTKIYALNENGGEYELIGKLWLNARKPVIDLRSLKIYPDDEAVIEIQSRTARKLFGRQLRIRLRGRVVTHRVEQNGNENYWFKVSTIEEDDEEI